jgi:hypothetical protein
MQIINKNTIALAAITLIGTLGTLSVSMGTFVLAQQAGPTVNCDPQTGGNPYAQGCPGNGQWTYPSPGVVCNRATGLCMHMSS